MSKDRAHLKITGKVQGVGFRASTRRRARKLGLSGWVKNLADGSVEAVVEGEKNDIQNLVSWAKKGPRRARVDEVNVSWKENQEEFRGFNIRY